MKISINSKSTILPFADAKEIILLSGFQNSSEVLQSSLNFFDLGDKNNSKLSLTDSMDFNNEIRFYLSGRRQRAYNHIGSYISELDEKVILEIYNSGNIKNADYDTYFLKLSAEQDMKQREKYLYKLANLSNKYVSSISLFNKEETWLISSDIQNVDFNSVSGTITWNVEEWKR